MKALHTLLMLALCVLLAGTVRGQTSRASSQPGQNVFSCSPAPCVLPPTQVSDGTEGYTLDPSIVADPSNPNHLLMGTDDDNCNKVGYSGFYVSRDGGASWTLHCMDGAEIDGDYLYPGGAMVGFDRNGIAYIATGYCCHNNCGDGIGFEKSTEYSTGWTAPALAFVTVCSAVEEYWMAVDASPESSFVNSIYISTQTRTLPYNNQNQVFVAHSHDGGAHWAKVAVDPPQLPPASDDYTNVTTGRDGTVYVTWQHCAAGGPDSGCKKGNVYMLFSKSTDGGNSWSPPTTMAKVTVAPTPCNCGIGELPNTDPPVYVADIPVIAVDNGNGPYDGNLYVTFYAWTGTYMQVQVIRSADGGNTWSQPVPVAPPTATHDQFMPWLSVSDSGLLGVSWLDRRNDKFNINYQAFAAISDDGGQTFPTNVRLTSTFSDPNNSGTYSIGNFIGNTWAGSKFLAVWPDEVNRVNFQAVIGGIRLR